MENGRNRDVVVIGGSAGALEPLKAIVAELAPELPAAVLVVLHMGANVTSMLAPILSRSGGPQAVTPRDGDPLLPGYVYVAEPDHHLEVTRHGMRSTHGPKVNGVRPSVDVLFQSAAATKGPHVVGVLLSGGLDDGSAGLASITHAGGITIVQDPQEAVIESMPRNAIAMTLPNHVARVSEIAGLITASVNEPAHPRARTKGGTGEMRGSVGADDLDGEITGLTCPECHGSIWMVGEPGATMFSCRVGHKYAPESFFEIQAGNVENALWAGVRSLEEQASLAQVMASRAERTGDEAGRQRFEHRRRIALGNAEVLRRVLVDRD